MNVIGVDPSSTLTGLALVRSGVPLRESLIGIKFVRLSGSCHYTKVKTKIWPALLPWMGGGVVVSIERVPDTARKDKKGQQAKIGWVQGYMAGLIVCLISPMKPPHTPQPADWRKTMIQIACANGLKLIKPTRGKARAAYNASLEAARPAATAARELIPLGGGVFSLVFDCGHSQTIAGGLEVARRRRPDPCPTCAGEAMVKINKGPADVELVRQAWKALACRFVAHFWPALYAPLVADARSRARNEKPDHMLNGVSDACEAVGIALHPIHAPNTARSS